MRASVLLFVLCIASPTLAGDLGPEPWLQYGSYEWGHRTTTEVEIGGVLYPLPVTVNYPADVAGQDVPVAAEGGPFPVVFFQHAFDSAPDNYDYVFSRLASRGIIVVSMDHTDEPVGDPLWWEWHRDLFTDTIDTIFLMNADTHCWLHGAVDSTRIGLAGHSHGAAFVAMREYRPMNPAAEYEITCVSLIAPCPDADIEDYTTTYAGMPSLQVIYGSKDQDGCVAYGQAIAMYEPHGRIGHFAYVIGASHTGFQDEGDMAGATISRQEHQRAAASAMTAYFAYELNGDASALPYLRGEEPLLEGPPEVRYQFHDVEHAPVDHCETVEGDSLATVVITGVPGQTFLNGFLSDTLVDFEAGVALVREEIERLLPPGPSQPYRVLFYENQALRPSVYAEALSREVAAGLIQTPMSTVFPSTFSGLIPWAPWDLIVAAHQSGTTVETQLFDEPLRDWVCGGGKAIISDFRIDAPSAGATLQCARSDYDGVTAWPVMSSAGDLFTGELLVQNPGHDIATYGLRTDAVVYATATGVLTGHRADVNSLGLAVESSGLTAFDEEFLLQPSRTLYHPTWGLELAWAGPGASLVETLSDSTSSGFDATGWDALSFRVLQLFGDPLNPVDETKDFHLQLVDAQGETARLALADANQGPLRYPADPIPVTGWKSIFETYRFPLADFTAANPALDLTRLERLELAFDLTPTGRIAIDDVEFTGEAAVATSVAGGGKEAAPGPAHLPANVWPNPFAASVRVEYTARPGKPVAVAVYDVKGRLVRTLARGLAGPGRHAVEWDGRDESGRRVAPGVYLVRWTSAELQATRKVVLAR